MSHDLLYPKKGYKASDRPLTAILIGLLAVLQLIASSSFLILRDPAKVVTAQAFLELLEGPQVYRFSKVVRRQGPDGSQTARQRGRSDLRRNISIVRSIGEGGPDDGAARLDQTIVTHGSDVFLKVPASERGDLPAGKSWARYDISQLQAAYEGSPYKDKKILVKMFSNVRELEPRVLRGTRVRVITARFDMEAFTRAMTAAEAKRRGVSASELQADLGETQQPTGSISAFVDQAGNLLRVASSMRMRTEDGITRSTCSSDLFDHGMRFRVPVPKAEDVFTLDPFGDRAEERFSTASSASIATIGAGGSGGPLQLMM